MASSGAGSGGGGAPLGGMPKGVRVKNRAPAPIQITAEHILLEARDRAESAAPAAPRRHITDLEELAEHRLRAASQQSMR